MVQKIIEIVGSSKRNFAEAAANGVAEAAKTVRDLKWARVTQEELRLGGKGISEYLVTLKIYFDVER